MSIYSFMVSLRMFFFLLFNFFILSCKSQNTELNTHITDSPNILIIIADDLGWSDIGFNGSDVKSPNIDKLAKEGTLLTNNYATPTCTPTRVGLLTGKYPSRYGILAPAYGEVIYKGDPTLASLLSSKGYSTHIVGKWHLGSPPHTPLKYGFQTSYGYSDGQVDPYTHIYKNGKNTWHRNDSLISENGHATDLITKEAIKIIKKRHDNPFFLYVAYSVPHYPLNEPKEWTSIYKDVNMFDSRRWFAGSITHMDDGIGQIISALEDTKQRKNTLILFISDNGGQKSWYSETEYNGKYASLPHEVLGNNFPLRGWKGDVYEGGIRVPAVINWPGLIKDTIFNIPVHVTDWLPTLMSVTGNEKALDSMIIDGKSMWQYIVGSKRPDDNIVKRVMYWKTPRDYAVREGKWKLIDHRNENEGFELYDLESDFRETKNMIDKEPQVAEHLKVILFDMQKGDNERH